MNKNCIVLLFLALFSFACNNESNQSSSSNSIGRDSSAVSNDMLTKDSNQISPDCTNTIMAFLKWYKTNYEIVNPMQDAVVSLKGDSANAIYRVDFDAAEKYLATLRASGFFSERFLQRTLQYFKGADVNLVKTKQNDGPPEGFEFDFLLLTQESESLLAHYKSSKTAFIAPNQVKLVLPENTLFFTVQVQQGNCIIDSIGLGTK
ncbi:hypothetical protein FAM09_14725 [Niastella caeni]|uniref:Uncharacterized protein n=1 Tax=Niastella caeni TaxID=2569763 RepID=A0A4S8HWB5_9BACT|nr:hypothetical protein [Niastella caeni]THU39745.1 hypothetical protein FAM09_14725 [Niastella caeni]